MLNGADPVIIFQFSKLAGTTLGALSKIPLISEIPSVIEQPPIPIYLSSNVTGVFIETEDKNVDIETDTETKTDGGAPDVNQKGIASGVTISLVAKKGSIGIVLLSAMIDVLFDKVSSKEYSISYLNGATTIFRAVLHSYSVNQEADSDKINIKIQLSKGTKTPTKKDDFPQVSGQQAAVPL